MSHEARLLAGASSDRRYASSMQRAATWVFIIASVAFGIIGSLFFITLVTGDVDSAVSQAVFALWGVSGSVVLASLGVSVAGRYLTERDDQPTP